MHHLPTSIAKIQSMLQPLSTQLASLTNSVAQITHMADSGLDLGLTIQEETKQLQQDGSWALYNLTLSFEVFMSSRRVPPNGEFL